MLLSSLRNVIILSDESIQIYSCSKARTKFIDSIPMDTIDFEEAVSNCLLKQGRGKPVVILNGMVEQHYRKEKVPKVTIMDQSNVLKRRLSVAFPNHPIRAALKLSGEKTDKKSINYLFAAMPSSDIFNKVVNSVLKAKISIVGVYLLPVEVAPLAKKLGSKLYSGEASNATWTIMVGQHRGGGLRQVVTRNGQLALTRMSPVVDTDIEPELWAGEVHSEIKATMSYLSRFGYTPNDGLNIIVIANDSCADILERVVDIDCNLKVLNAKDAASALSLRLGQHDDLRYADTLYASFLGQVSKFVLPMETPLISQFVRPRQIASLATIALLIGTAAVGFFLFKSIQEGAVVKDKLLIAQQQTNALQEEYDIELEKKKKLGFDFLLVNNSLQVFNQHQKSKAYYLKTIREIGLSLGTDLTIDKIIMSVAEVKQQQQNPYAYPEQELSNEGQPTENVKSVLMMSFAKDIEPDVGVSLVNELRNRIQINLPQHKVEIAKQVAGLSYTGNFSGEAGVDEEATAEEQELTAEIVIQGALSW